MPSLETKYTSPDIHNSMETLGSYLYIGRIIVMGFNAGKTKIYVMAGLTARSPVPRNRKYVEFADRSIRVVPDQQSAATAWNAKEAALLYYQATKHGGGVSVVSNGAQTAPVYDSILAGNDLETAVRSAPGDGDIKLSEYEPDPPIYTPRITGVVDLRPDAPTPFGLALVRKAADSDEPVYSVHTAESIDELPHGAGYALQTYKGQGDPTLSFDQAPYPVFFTRDIFGSTQSVWEQLNKENFVAIAAQAIDLGSTAVEKALIY